MFKNSFSSLSHLSPLLFSIFINDLPLVLTKSRVLMYAADVKLFLQYNDRTQSLALPSDINAFETWSMDN